MATRLYLARHAKSSWDDPSLSDFERPLNKRGMRDAPFMAGVLACRDEHPKLIVSSPARRAEETAKFYHHYLGGELRFDSRIYEAGTVSLYYLILEYFDKTDNLMIVGHNPGLTELNNYVCNEMIDNIPTAGVVGLDFEKNIAPHQARRLFYLYPKAFIPR